MNSPDVHESDDRVIPAILGLAAMAVLTPVFLVQIPTLWDYPNHLVRLWILAGGAEGTPVAAMYQADWSLARTNIGIDLLGSLLGRLMPVEQAGKVLVCLGLTVAPFGAIALNRSIFGGRHWWMIAIMMFAWNFVVVGGLLSFQIGLGLALFAASTETLLARRSMLVAALVRIAFGAVILTVHVFGLLFYLALVVGIAFGSDWLALRDAQRFRRFLRGAILGGLACVVPLVAMLALASKLPGAHVEASAGGGARQMWEGMRFPPLELLERLSITLTSLKTYALAPDLLALAAVVTLPLYALLTRRLAMHAGLFAASILLFVLSQFMPASALGTGYIDVRLPAMAGLMMAASVRPDFRESMRVRRALALLMLIAVSARAAWIWSVWSERQGDVRSIAAVSADIPANAAVLLARHYTGDVSDPRLPAGRYAHGQPIFWHMPTLITIWRHAFVPTIFTAAGKQPLRVLPSWIDKAVPEGGIPMVDELDQPASLREYHYLRDWRRRFDYVLLVNADMPNREPGAEAVPGLRLVSDGGFARLYRIERAP
ncbi:MAG: hypothetical protein JNK84_22865 [Phreatobacter sp.]|uniref:hypothetical protein n=1 Tax=Phreatobacter sp. TaxID=1966341 RepID=UPI001A55269B|nr:hypothetical protein [Phreatobacter sp.]MBL8571926.1 hypothetical protein [Phreatobacter sp.]